MKQANRVLSTYAADVSGVCSALFELGGMTIMHDASGCNSTYNTHDEPRWYDTDSMVYISALTEIDAIMGADEKLIGDACAAAEQLCPAFVALAGTPIPTLMGTDLPGAAAEIESRTLIPSIGLPTTGMSSYSNGASLAFEAIAKQFCKNVPKTGGVNILGATPLDLSINGEIEALRAAFIKNGLKINSCWAMGSALGELKNAAAAEVNAVISASGLRAARLLEKRFGTPYTVGLPFGGFSEKYFKALKNAAKTGQSGVAYETPGGGQAPVLLIGEAVFMGSLAEAMRAAGVKNVQTVCPLEPVCPANYYQDAEKELEELIKSARAVVADPLFERICPGKKFLPLPHEAYSGRTFRADIPVLTEESFYKWFGGIGS